MSDEKLVEVSEKASMRREEAAARLRELADQLARHNRVEFSRDGLRYSVKVPDQLQMEIEVEVGENSEIEIEISW